MKDVLICCTNAEGSQLEWLARALLDSGWTVSFMHKGSRGVAKANCVIAVWSPHSVGDAWLTARAQTAAKGRKLVSVRLGGARPPRGLRSEQIIDLSEWPARGADRAINKLLVTVDHVASGTVVRDRDGGSRRWIALVAVLLLVVGGYLLFARLAATGAISPAGQRTAMSADRATSRRSMNDTTGSSAAPPTGVSGSRSNSTDVNVPVRPVAQTTDAARIGAQALSQLTALIDGADLPLDQVRRAAEAALALDAQEPRALATVAVLRGLADLNWSAAAQDLSTIDAAPSDPALAGIVGPYRALVGAAPVPVMRDEPRHRLCDVSDDAAFAQAFIELAGAQRLALLQLRCVIVRIHDDPDLQRLLGIAR